MNRKMIAYTLGRVLLVEGALMLLSVIVGLIYKESETIIFIPSIMISFAAGLLVFSKKPENTTIYAREGFFIVAAAWILMSVIGCLPFILCGENISFSTAFFETVSGFTTTGATALTEVESLPKCLLFWRSFTHWVGGMGVLVFVLAIIPMADNRSLHLMRAEVPGPVVGKLVPKMKETAKILYIVYSAMTAVLIILLVFGGMPLFDSVCHAFGAAGTGGFSIKNAGIMFYDSAYLEMVLSVFMLLFGINFNLFYLILIKRAKAAFKSEELRIYILIVAASVLIIALDILGIYKNFGEALRYSFFQVSSIITTTGYATADFAAKWPQLSKHVLVLLMIIGACAGSTGGGLKVSRLIILIKSGLNEVRRMIHPRMVSAVQLDGKAIDRETIDSTRSYLALYMIIICVSTLILSMNGYDLETNLTAELSCFNNIGPGIGLVGPLGNFSIYSAAEKLLLSLNMLLGRLEIFPMLVLFSPSMWKKRTA